MKLLVEQKRKQLEYRLEQARSAERNWPSTRARCEVMRLENELERNRKKDELIGCTS